jgi:hypothetical protein
MKRGWGLALAVVVVGVGGSGRAWADGRGHGDHDRFRVVPEAFDPAHTRAVQADWLPFSDHHDEALVLAKLLPTSANAAAGARIEGVEGIRLRELGFDVYAGGHCGAGAPRFDVTTVDGTTYFFGCLYGTHTPAADKPTTFERVRFSDADAAPQLVGDPPWPGFGHARIASISITFDEGTDQGSGFTALDNIDINGVLVGDDDDDDGHGHGHGHCDHR